MKHAGRHFLQIPGPTNVPDRILRAIANATIDHRGPGFQKLGQVACKVFRIGHLGDFNDLMLAGTLAGVEMGLALAGVPHKKGGVMAAIAYLSSADVYAADHKAKAA